MNEFAASPLTTTAAAATTTTTRTATAAATTTKPTATVTTTTTRSHLHNGSYAFFVLEFENAAPTDKVGPGEGSEGGGWK